MAHARRPAPDHAPPKRTAWHVFFAALLLERRSPDFDVLADVPLSFEPQRADLLLLRKLRSGGPLPVLVSGPRARRSAGGGAGSRAGAEA